MNDRRRRAHERTACGRYHSHGCTIRATAATAALGQPASQLASQPASPPATTRLACLLARASQPASQPASQTAKLPASQSVVPAQPSPVKSKRAKPSEPIHLTLRSPGQPTWIQLGQAQPNPVWLSSRGSEPGSQVTSAS